MSEKALNPHAPQSIKSQIIGTFQDFPSNPHNRIAHAHALMLHEKRLPAVCTCLQCPHWKFTKIITVDIVCKLKKLDPPILGQPLLSQ
jgi:hypothetical protein